MIIFVSGSADIDDLSGKSSDHSKEEPPGPGASHMEDCPNAKTNDLKQPHKTTLFVPVKETQWPIVYSPDYNIGFLGLEKLHPFDSGKWGKVFNHLKGTIKLGSGYRPYLVFYGTLSSEVLSPCGKCAEGGDSKEGTLVSEDVCTQFAI